MKSIMIVMLILGAVYYYLTEYSGKDNSQGSGFVQQKDKKPKGVIPQHQLDALKKAKSVEDTINKSVKEKMENL